MVALSVGSCAVVPCVAVPLGALDCAVSDCAERAAKKVATEPEPQRDAGRLPSGSAHAHEEEAGAAVMPHQTGGILGEKII